ncbi:MAG: proline--tRNA ligase [Clostridia bacterium]|nr:proline--tRNA ligase [Clostridia bacterium]
MLMSKLVGERVKENPSDVQIKSHALMMRGGYMKQVANGIYSFLPPTQKISQKIQNIIREEMDAIDGQEVLFPVVMPKELWEESGRYTSIGGEMVRFQDRGEKWMCLGMTHEEAAVHMARNTVNSYQQMPFMIYQIQTKFRDEKRARGGLIRVREFTMKDAYSFHMTQEDLEKYYERAYEAYLRIYKRIGMKNVIAVKSDSGMMGGSISHEFMLLTPIGEDTIAICPDCGYKANMEVANGISEDFDYGEDKQIEEVFTGDAKDIAEVCKMLNVKEENTIKAVSFAIKGDSQKSCLVFIRGDKEVNEAKLKKVIKMEVAPNDLSESVLVAGNIGAYNLKTDDNTVIVYDQSLKGAYNLITGANKPEYHLSGVNVERDLDVVEFFDVAKVKEGDGCPNCKSGKITLQKGIEIGNIFQLGTKYTEKMGMTVLDEKGEAQVPIMGCYGIGVGRSIASIAEESNDDRGIIWPMTVAPWQVYLCPLRYDDQKVKEEANKLYEELKKKGVEVIFDDRNANPGVKFADHELLGVPLRVVVSPRSLANGQAELQARDGSMKEMVAIDGVVDFVLDYIAKEMQKLNG